MTTTQLFIKCYHFIEVKARERKCDISGYLQMKKKKWKKQWLEVTEFALYVFEKHEDVSSKMSVTLPGYTVIYPIPVELKSIQNYSKVFKHLFSIGQQQQSKILSLPSRSWITVF